MKKGSRKEGKAGGKTTAKADVQANSGKSQSSLKDKFTNSVFAKSLNIKAHWKILLTTLCLDLLCCIILFGIVAFSAIKLIYPLYYQIISASPVLQNAVSSGYPAQFSEQILSANSAYVKMQIYVVALFVISIIVWSIFNGLIWSKLRQRNSKISSISYYLKLSLFNAVFFVLFILLCFSVVMSYVKPEVMPWLLIFIILPLAVYISAVFHCVFDGSWRSFANAFKTMIYIWRLFLPAFLYAVFGIIFVMIPALAIASSLMATAYVSLTAANSIDLIVMSIIIVFVFMPVFSWARNYFALAIEKVEYDITLKK